MDNDKEFDLPSGAKLFVSVSSFALAKKLQDTLLAELRGKGAGTLDVAAIQKAMGIGAAKKAGLEVTEGEDEEGLNTLVDRILGIAASKDVEDAIFACAEKAVYRPDGTEGSSVQVTRKLFDDPQYRDSAREDFYAICSRVAEVNIRPFVKALSSMFSDRAGKSAATQESNTEPELAKQTS